MQFFRSAIHRWAILIFALELLQVCAEEDPESTPWRDTKPSQGYSDHQQNFADFERAKNGMFKDMSHLRGTEMGALKLDNNTLPKVIELVKASPGSYLLVKFARALWTVDEYANPQDLGHARMKTNALGDIGHICDKPGMQHLCHGMSKEDRQAFDEMQPVRIDVFALLTAKLYETPKLVIAEVDVDYHDDAPGMPNLEEKYKLNSDHFPNWVAYSAEAPTGEKYHGQNVYADIALWLMIKTKLEIAHDVFPEFDDDVYKYLFEPKMKERMINKLTKKAATKGDLKIPHYLKVMQKLQEKDMSYIDTELKRTGELLMEKLPGNTRTELTNKWKVLHHFQRIWRAGERKKEL